MVDEIHDGIASMLADPEVRVLVLASAVEGYLSAGADLNVFKGMTPDGTADGGTGDSGDGCGCSLGGRTPAASWSVLLVSGLLLFASRRRR